MRYWPRWDIAWCMAGRNIANRNVITAEMITELHRLSPFDPEHMPEEILLTEAFHHRFPDLAQVACFDTAFHHDLPRVAQIVADPAPLRGTGHKALRVSRFVI